jgi:adenylyl cyclase-associated protein
VLRLHDKQTARARLLRSPKFGRLDREVIETGISFVDTTTTTMGLFGRPKSPEVGGAGGAGGAPSSSSLAAYDAMVAEHLAPMRDAAATTADAATAPLGLAAPTERVEAAFAAQRAAIAAAASSSSGRPSDPATIQALLAPVAAEMTAASAAADKAPPRSAAGLALQATAEALQALAWLALPPPAVSPSPAQHVADAWSAAEFYANKLLMEARNSGGGEGGGGGGGGTGAAAAKWVAGLKGLVCTGLKAYVTAHHARGLAFGGGGGGVGAAASAAAPPPAAPAKRAGPPPPPPPPPPGGPPSASALLSERKSGQPPASAPPAAAAAGGGMSAVLASLNRGTAVTSGLRKVTDDMKAKNRADRPGAVPASASAGAPSAPAPTPAPGLAPGKKPPTAPPRLELEQDRRWVVENHTAASASAGVNNNATPNNPQQPGVIVVKVSDPKQAVYVSRCSGPGLVIRVEGRVATLTVDACSRVGVVFDEVVAAAEVVNCQSVQMQCLGRARTVSVDKTDGCQVFVPSSVALGGGGGAGGGAGGDGVGGGCGDFQLVTAKSSEVNLTVVPTAEEMDAQGMDAVEHAVPEQFVSTFGKDGKLLTVPASHGGG